ncbi:hypothetical protein HYH02_013122 [Chlamydomonas schloesseri]|uniref:Uncharacterized protein n=1 Tax=Chlamydomonas schloesseri TaxID=2026947 RepID=A0A835SRM4_9CHLO|nr:hypothetical protein HYH02_013122 [Chlamydomonas schloesseri]|eukprot:KAG2432052.1 hypothetical protein HYH02_013122 [Chlamydomonas schloesseri]
MPGSVPELRVNKTLNTLNHLSKLKEVRVLGPSPNDLIAEAFEQKAHASSEAFRWKAQHLADIKDEVRASQRFLYVGLPVQQPQPPPGGDPLLAEDDEDDRARMPAYRLGVDAFSDDEASGPQLASEACAATGADAQQEPGQGRSAAAAAAGSSGEEPAGAVSERAPGPPMRLMTVRPAALQALQLPTGPEGGAVSNSGGAPASPAGTSTPTRSPAVSGKLPVLRLGGGVSRVQPSPAEGCTGPLSTSGAGRSGGTSPGGVELLGWSSAAAMASGGTGAGSTASGSMPFLSPNEMGDGVPRSPVIRNSMPGSLLPTGQTLINAAASRFSGSGQTAAPSAPAAAATPLLGISPNSTGGMAAPVSVSTMFAVAQGGACTSAPLPRLSLDRPSPAEAAALKALVSPLPGGGRGANRLYALDVPPTAAAAASNIAPAAFGAESRAGSRSESPSQQLRSFGVSSSRAGSSPSSLRRSTGGEDCGMRGGHLAPLPVAASRFAPALPSLPPPANRASGLPSLNA